jgi:hypothetical protein
MQRYRENEIAFYGFRALVTDVPAVLHRHCSQTRFRLPNVPAQQRRTIDPAMPLDSIRPLIQRLVRRQ